MARDGSVSGGRPKGSPNKRTWEAREIAERLGFCPLEILAHFAMGNWKALGYDKPTKTIYSAEGMPIEVDRIDEALRQKSAKDAAPFLLPQLKSMELTGDAGAAAAMALTQMLASAVAKKESKNAGNGGTEPGTDS